MPNLKGFWTLLSRETNKFIKVISQALIAPVITSLLYIIVFGKFIGSQIPKVNDLTYMEFLIPGLIMMSVRSRFFLCNCSISLPFSSIAMIFPWLMMPILLAKRSASSM